MGFRTMKKLDETEDDQYLAPGQRTEEYLGSVDYDVYVCPGCDATKAAATNPQAVENWAQMKGLCSALYPSVYYLIGLPTDIRQYIQQP